MEHIWDKYSQTVIDFWQKPKNMGKIEKPDGYAQIKGTCGDTMEIYLNIKNQTISACTFQTDGCGPAIACGSAVTELAKGQSSMDALISASENGILEKLEGLPYENVHCAILAAETFRSALDNYLCHLGTKDPKIKIKSSHN